MKKLLTLILSFFNEIPKYIKVIFTFWFIINLILLSLSEKEISIPKKELIKYDYGYGDRSDYDYKDIVVSINSDGRGYSNNGDTFLVFAERQRDWIIDGWNPHGYPKDLVNKSDKYIVNYLVDRMVWANDNTKPYYKIITRPDIIKYPSGRHFYLMDFIETYLFEGMDLKKAYKLDLPSLYLDSYDYEEFFLNILVPVLLFISILLSIKLTKFLKKIKKFLKKIFPKLSIIFKEKSQTNLLKRKKIITSIYLFYVLILLAIWTDENPNIFVVIFFLVSPFIIYFAIKSLLEGIKDKNKD